MKTKGFLFLAMVWAAWMQGKGFAVQASSANAASAHPGDSGRAATVGDGKHSTDVKVSEEQRGHGPMTKLNRPPIHANLAKVNHPAQLPNSRLHPFPLRPPDSFQPVGAARGGWVPNGTFHVASPVRMASVGNSTVPAVNSVRHRSPNPAVVGGALSTRVTNTGVINGTRMDHKR
jgi:hypothetical protein